MTDIVDGSWEESGVSMKLLRFCYCQSETDLEHNPV